MAAHSRRGLSSFPALWASLRRSDSIAARGCVVGGYGLLFASQPPYVRAAVLFYKCKCGADPRLTHSHLVRLRPDFPGPGTDLRMLTNHHARLDRDALRD